MNITYLLDRLAESFPERAAILGEEGANRTWAECRERVDRLASVIAARGVGARDRVAILALNGPHYLEASWAVARLGAILQPMNFRLSAAELAHQRADAEPKLLLLSEALGELAGGFAADLPTIFVDGVGADALEALVAAAEPLAEPYPVAGDDTLGIFYTSGTTGEPKGVMLTHNNVLSNAAFLVPTVGYAAEDVTLHAAPMFHVSDFCASFAQLIAGGRHCFVPRFDPDAVLAAIERHRASNLILIPVMINALIARPEVARHDLSSWRFLFYGGSPIAAETLRRCFEVLPCELVQGYGQTEATHTVSVLSAADHRRAADRPELLASCGQPLPGVQVRVGDDDDRPLAEGEPGEILVRAPNVMKGYWNQPQATAEALRGGWLHTGDIGVRDAEGYLSLVDRKKDMIISGGENVFSAEVEQALASHSAVAECAAIAVPDARLGERVHAVVVLGDSAAPSLEELQDHCRRAIAGYKIPRSLEFVEALPRTGIGKVRKALLRQPHWQDTERNIR